jgi:GTPase SAR1 family protein
MRIGLCGTVSVGKTTLINELSKLSEFKDYHFATERSKYLRDLGIPLNTDSTLKGQTIFLAERCSELIRENILTDRTVIDVMAFTMNADSITTSEKDAFIYYASQFISEYDYIFYVSPIGVEIENNGVRETNSEYRNQIDLTIRHLINQVLPSFKNFGIISGSTTDRIKQIRSYLNFKYL